MPKPLNVLFILSEHHHAGFLGCAGDAITRTPNLDRLAAEGTRFDYTYCASPACVPARGALWSGRHGFETGVWCNATPWDGRSGGWSFYLRDQGVHVATIGKLDFKPGCDHGISDERFPRHRNSLDIHSLYRTQPILPRPADLNHIKAPRRDPNFADPIGDDKTLAEAVEWLGQRGADEEPWLLNVNFLKAHPDWVPPVRYWDYYDSKVRLEDMSPKYFQPLEDLHPYCRTFAEHQCAAEATREDIRHAHIGFRSFVEMLDEQVGTLLQTLERHGLAENTVVVYGSDHGVALHAHRCWGILNLWDDTARVPLIIRHPGGTRGHVDRLPTHHHDVFPTICEALGRPVPADFRGHSLLDAVVSADSAPRREFSICESHSNGWPGSSFAVSDGHMKYVECVGERSMLFNLDDDPDEMQDLVVERPNDPATIAAIDRARRHLCELCSPQAVDVRAKEDQEQLRLRLEQTGQLARELVKRGYEPQGDRLIPSHRQAVVGQPPEI